jgi:hypothetical protein
MRVERDMFCAVNVMGVAPARVLTGVLNRPAGHPRVLTRVLKRVLKRVLTECPNLPPSTSL